MAAQRIVIIGGGFGGVKCAQTLRAGLRPRDAEIILFNKENHLVFSPLLADAVGSSLNLLDVIVPLRQLLPGVQCRTEEVRSIDLVGRHLEFEGHDGLPRRLDYDHVVIACGNVSNLNVVPGMADHAFPLKTVGDAAVLRTHVLQQMEKAEVCDDPEKRRWYLSFIVVGGGYSGVEIAGEVNDLVRSSLRFYANIRDADVSVTLIHSREQLLPEISPPLREFARAKMEKAGVTMKLNARVQLATGEGVGLKDDFVRGGTIVCTIGSTTAPVVARLKAPMEKGRLLTRPDMRIAGQTQAWAIGDCAHILNAVDGQPSPPTGQFAERQGRQCAENILRGLRGEPTRPFAFRVLGQLCSIGGHSAVAELFGLKLSGFWAWFTWRGVYLFKLPAWSRRIQVGFDWAWLLLFPRDLSHIKTDVTDRVTHAHYEPGDYIIRQGEPPANFYVIEQGEVEIIRVLPGRTEGEVIATLGPGNFFGEQALINQRPRSASVRARTAAEIVVMGRNVFSSISKSLAPLRQALTTAIVRRSGAIWQERPAVTDALRRLPLTEFIEPAPQPFLRPDDTLYGVSLRFARDPADFFYVSADGARLDGLITLTDLLRTQATGAPPETPLGNFMTKNPAAIAATDTTLIAASAFREHGYKSLPVVTDQASRRIVGVMRVRRLISRVMQLVPPPTGTTVPPVTNGPAG
ncbi:MAG: FAD-dependent oxidoreductase [Opitutaceae bacterium]|nr:FAD-dependent oxidoreductase [Opitutaceae bacterium]